MTEFELSDLSGDQIEKVLQLQDLINNEDLSVCRDVLQRHNWNLEVAVQEQLNLFEGRPSMYAQDTRVRPPPVVDESNSRVYYSPVRTPGGGGFFSFLIPFCYNFVASVLQFIFSIFRRNPRPVSLDPVQDVINFIKEYEEEYSTNHPVFYQGSYSQALSDAKQELRFLIVYLHKSESQEVDDWCRSTLGNQELIRYINTHSLFWACNIKSGEGFKVAEDIRTGTYPFLAVIVLKDNKMTIVGRMEGIPTPSELTSQLQSIIESNEINLIQARQDRAERSLTQSIRQQQDQAYEESLRADQEKDRKREEKRKEREAEKAREQEHLDAIEAEIERMKKEKQLAIDKVPEEPDPKDPNACHLQIKLGERTVKRRFLQSHTIEDVYNWIFSQEDSPCKFELMTSYPRRILYPSKDVMTLLNAGLTHREVLHINDLDD